MLSADCQPKPCSWHRDALLAGDKMKGWSRAGCALQGVVSVWGPHTMNPFHTLPSLTTHCITAWFEIPFLVIRGKVPSHSIDKSSQSLALPELYQGFLLPQETTWSSGDSLSHTGTLILPVRPPLTQCLPHFCSIPELIIFPQSTGLTRALKSTCSLGQACVLFPSSNIPLKETGLSAAEPCKAASEADRPPTEFCHPASSAGQREVCSVLAQTRCTAGWGTFDRSLWSVFAMLESQAQGAICTETQKQQAVHKFHFLSNA